jgi:rod shape-determining protein MreB
LADFTVAEKLLQHAVHQLATNALLRPSPRMILHPLEKTEGGLTQVEVRAWQELAAGAGARSAAVWIGADLSDADILEHRYPGEAWLPEPPKWARRR